MVPSFFNINDVMISLFAADNGRQMCVNGLPCKRGGLLKDIDLERSQTHLSPCLILIVKFKSETDKHSDYI